MVKREVLNLMSAEERAAGAEEAVVSGPAALAAVLAWPRDRKLKKLALYLASGHNNCFGEDGGSSPRLGS